MDMYGQNVKVKVIGIVWENVIYSIQTSIFQRVLFDSKGWCIGTPYHPFSTLWKIQGCIQYNHHRLIAMLHWITLPWTVTSNFVFMSEYILQNISNILYRSSLHSTSIRKWHIQLFNLNHLGTEYGLSASSAIACIVSSHTTNSTLTRIALSVHVSTV